VLGRVQVVLEDLVEDELRDRAKKKGDISRIINQALKQFWGGEGVG